MVDLFWPRDIVPNDVEWRLLDSTGVFASPLSGVVRTVSRPGTNRWGVRLNFRNLRDSQRYRVMSVLAALRGQSNRIWISDVSSRRRGSFSTGELLANNTFANGTTGWSSDSDVTLSATDRVLRMVRTAVTTAPNSLYPTAAATVTQYAAYVVRAHLRSGRGTFAPNLTVGSAATANDFGVLVASYGMNALAFVPRAASAAIGLEDGVSSGVTAGDFFECAYLSMSRGALVDNGPNLLLRSDEFDNAAWTKTNLTITANSVASPDGTTTADLLVENVSAGVHAVSQAVTISTAAAEYAFCVAVKANVRNFCALEMQENAGSTTVTQYFNLSTGAVGSTGATGANWSDRRASIAALGNGWYMCCLVARKTSAATQVAPVLYAATADGTSSYTGGGNTAILAWRATLAQSSVPGRVTQTTTTASSGVSQTGSALYLKGLPASTSGLLELGDMAQIGSELKRATARLSSDAAGLGYFQFEPAMRTTPANSAPVIFQEPMGKFLLNSDETVWPTRPGKFSDFSLDFVEAVGN